MAASKVASVVSAATAVTVAVTAAAAEIVVATAAPRRTATDSCSKNHFFNNTSHF